MEKLDVESIMDKYLNKRYFSTSPPREEDWTEIEKKLDFSFPKEYKYFINLLSVYMYYGEVFDISEDRKTTNEIDIYSAYIDEVVNYNWNKNFIPFISIGNGDYLCLNKTDSKVYYYWHDLDELHQFEHINNSFKDWLLDLEKWT